MTYVRNLSEKLRGIIREKIPNVQITFKSNNTIGKHFFTKVKDKTLKENKSGVVYKIECKDCDKCYIGQTKNKLKTRLSKHKSDVKTNKDLATELSSHSLREGHVFDFDSTKILSIENNDKKRSFLEMWHIKKHKTVNKRTDIEGLSNIYSNIMSKSH